MGDLVRMVKDYVESFLFVGKGINIRLWEFWEKFNVIFFGGIWLGVICENMEKCEVGMD